MKNRIITTLIIACLLSCKNEIEDYKIRFLTDKIPDSNPVAFKESLIPRDKLIHKGAFSPDMEAYYYTISDKNFEQFDIYVISKMNGQWSEPKEAFFNSKYNEHGMSFSPDGNFIYFSSTRPTNTTGVLDTWHIWKSDKVNGTWNEPSFVDIPNLKDKLVSHPTISNQGTLYFHVSNLDYSEMDIYYSKKIKDAFGNAQKAIITLNSDAGKCTPFVSPNAEYLIFASIGNQLDLWVSFNDGKGNWINTKRLSDKINNFGQGNPYVTPDHKFLFFTTGEDQEQKWSIKWVDIASELKIN